jgi:hypothetical protein
MKMNEQNETKTTNDVASDSERRCSMTSFIAAVARSRVPGMEAHAEDARALLADSDRLAEVVGR